jgi:phosphate transport system protein
VVVAASVASCTIFVALALKPVMSSQIRGEALVSPQKVVAGLQHMSELAMAQLKDVLDAYVQKNSKAALDVWQRDGQIDSLNTSLFRELLTYMMEDPRNISFCTHLLFVAKNVERIGDHTTNIAETVHYLASGETLTAERPKNDRSSDAMAQENA